MLINILQEIISGLVVIHCGNDIKHDGITINLDGTVVLQLSNKNIGVFEAFYNSVKVFICLFKKKKKIIYVNILILY